MQRRDRVEGKGREGHRSHAPAFMQFDDDDNLADADIVGRRRRRHYDEQPDKMDDGADNEMPLDQIADVKTDSIAQWIAELSVRNTIAREFRNFLVTYVDEKGISVYGQRVRALGEREWEVAAKDEAISDDQVTTKLTSSLSVLSIASQLRVARGFIYASRRRQSSACLLPCAVPGADARHL